MGRALGIRHAPELRFELDPNVEYAARMDALLRSLPAAAEAPAREPETVSAEPGAEGEE